MTLLPGSLFGRLVLTLVGALLLAQIASVALTLYDRGRVLHSQAGWQVSQRVAAVVRLLDELPPRARRRVARAFSAPPMRLRLSVAPLPPSGVAIGGAAGAMMQALLQRRLGADRELRIETLDGGAAGEGHEMPMPMMMPDPPGFRPRAHRWMMGRAPQVYRVQVRLADGMWAVFENRVRRDLFAWPREWLGAIAVLLISVVAVSLWVVRRMTRPLAMLAGAAEALGRDLNAPPLVETGPTEVREAAHAFNTMQARLARFIDDRARILAAVSHDLKTPLTRLRLRTELLDDQGARERFGADLDEMQQMVQSALDFARGLDDTEASRTVDIEALCAALAEDVPGASGRVRVVGGAAPWRGRAHALRRCLSNLLVNALRYSDDQVEVRIEDRDAQLLIHILDRGPGIPEPELARVLEPYYRVEGSRSRESGGSGLGLSIARAVARAHGGDLRLANRGDGGLEAQVALPR